MKSIQVIYIFVLIAISCSKKLDLTSHFDTTQSFQVVDLEKANDDRSETEIQVNDLKHDQLLSWLKSNNQNWKPTQLSYASLFIISQENFRLLLYRNNDFVVVRFIDDENISHQYVKIVDSDELNFLDEK